MTKTYVKIDADHYKEIDTDEVPLVLSELKKELVDQQAYNVKIAQARAIYDTLPDDMKIHFNLIPPVFTKPLEELITILEALGVQ